MKSLSRVLCDQMAAYGYPPERTELLFARPWRLFRFDLAWPSRGLAAEADGGQWAAQNGDKSRHFSGAGIGRDAQKVALAQLLGWTVYRFPTDMIRDGSAALVLVAAIHQGNGWPVWDDPGLLRGLGVDPKHYAAGVPLSPDQWAAGESPPSPRRRRRT